MDSLLESLSESYPAVAASLAPARRAVTALAATAGATAEQLDDIRLAASEAFTNVITHAYGDRSGDIHVTAAVAGSELWLLVSDDGDGLSQRSRKPGLGLGLTLIAQACEQLTIVKRSNGGTELRMRFTLGVARPQPDRYDRGSDSSARSAPASVFSTTR